MWPIRVVRMKTRLIKTAMSGAAASAVDVVCIVALVELAGVAVGASAFVAACVGSSVSFTLSKFWAFSCRRPVHTEQVASFAGVALGTAAFNGVIVHFGYSVLGLPYLIAWLATAVGVFLVWSYPAQARLVFAPRTP